MSEEKNKKNKSINDNRKIITKKIATTGVRTIGDIIALILKIVGSILLIAVTTGIIFSCIFLIYVRTNLAEGLDVNPADFNMELSSVIYWVDTETGSEEELVTIQSAEYRAWVDYEDIPKHMERALVAIEDQRFYKHNGVDWYRTAGAFVNMFMSMKNTFGGSTITQQLIKNLTHEDDVTVQRKMLEIFRALEYEKEHEKDEILELYMNLVYFGHGCYGIGAAADYYFGKEVPDLTLAESASIIAITNNPSKFSPYSDKKENKARQTDILWKMEQLGYITEREYRNALDEELVFRRGEGSVHEDTIYTWFEEAVIRDVIADLAAEKGVPEQIARRLLYTGGYRIIATIDVNMQKIVDEVYEDVEALPKVTGSSQRLQSGIVIADPYTGEIKALSGGTGEKRRNMLLNRATMSRRPPGSSIKPISAYAPAMENRILTPDTKYDDSEFARLSGTDWMPRNDNRKYTDGIVDVRTAIRRSINTVAAQVIDELKPSVSYRFMTEELGFKLDPADEDYAPLSLGQLTYGATVREMASGYTMFPNGGERMALRTYSKVYDSDDLLVLDNGPEPTVAISEAVAYNMTDLLADAVRNGTGGEANLGNLGSGVMPTAGKTGTTSDKKDRWFVGFTPYYVCAVWTGFDTPAVMTSNGNPAAQMWKRIMSDIHKELEPRTFGTSGGNTALPTVNGGARVAEYTVRCVDLYGGVLSEETKEDVIDRSRTVHAPDIEGYWATGETEKAVTINENPERNIVIFTYAEIIPEPENTDDGTEDPLWTEEPPWGENFPETEPPVPETYPPGQSPDQLTPPPQLPE